MGQVLIRNLPDAVIEAHRHRAKANGRSLEQELRSLIESTAPYTPAERSAIAEHAQNLTPPGPRSDPAGLVSEDRAR